MSSNSNTDDDFNSDNNNEDEEEEEERKRLEQFRKRMMSMESSLGLSEDSNENENDDNDEFASFSKSTQLEDEAGIDELIRFASSSCNEDSSMLAGETLWARPLTAENKGGVGKILNGGVVLLANPSKFCTDFCMDDDVFSRGGNSISSSLLTKFGLTLPPPAEIGPDRRADLLPVVLLIDSGNVLTGSYGVLLNRRTGYLIGDLEQQRPPPLRDQSVPVKDETTGKMRQDIGPADVVEDDSYMPKLGAFMIQPLWFGGTSSSNTNGNVNDSIPRRSSGGSNGLDMLHRCESIQNSKRLTEDGLYWGGDPVEAQDVMEEHNKKCESMSDMLSGFDFKFFVQSTRWLPTMLEKEVKDGTWFVAEVSKDVLFKSRDRMGTRRGKPLWTEIMELMGSDYLQIKQKFYNEEDEFEDDNDSNGKGNNGGTFM